MKKLMKKSAQKGFTLIELAVVIAIIAILAAVGLTGMQGMNISGERAVARDFINQLKSGASLYIARMGLPAAGFDDYVTNGALSSTAPAPAVGADFFTVDASGLGPGTGNCAILAATVTCGNTVFPALRADLGADIVYTYTPATGRITANI
ncbi:MAG: prepilin-type N-terminal cleavage/methylation domain-containing protein [Vampirovibrionales bacterium]|nr:prepilin-type N-terminal cleavage/methylation domain-containing protein [Vampirovibrionales bacterium]